MIEDFDEIKKRIRYIVITYITIPLIGYEISGDFSWVDYLIYISVVVLVEPWIGRITQRINK